MRKAIENENFCDLDKTRKTSSTVMCWKRENIYTILLLKIKKTKKPSCSFRHITYSSFSLRPST